MPTDSDVVFSAYVEDHTLEFFEKFDKGIDKLAQHADAGFKQVDNSIQTSAVTVAQIVGVYDPIISRLLTVVEAGINGIRDFAASSINLTARVDELGVALNQMGGKAGYSKDELDAYEKSLKETGITTQAARQSMMRMIRANIDLADAAKLARVAQDSAVSAGMNSSMAFDRLVLGIQKREPELLDELGLTLDRASAYDTYAASLGKSSKQLTLAEQQQAILNSIYEQSASVAGLYEAAMGSVGKQVRSLPRYIEELQLSLGVLFQPAYTAKVDAQRDALKELQEWFDNNSESIEIMSHSLGMLTSTSLDALSELVHLLVGMPKLIENVGVGIAKVIASMADGTEGVKQVEENSKHLSESFRQLMALLSASVSTWVKQAKEGFQIWGELASQVYYKAIHDTDALAESTERLNRLIESSCTIEGFREKYAESFMVTSEFFGLIESESENADAAMTEATDAANALKAAFVDASNAVKKLHDELASELTKKAIAEVRRMQEESIRQAWRMEDLERNHQSRLESILENANESRAQALKNANDTRLSIWESYHRRLRDLQSSFNYQADELARRRDAVGLLRLIRQHKKQLKEEEQQRDDKLADAKKAFNDEMQQMEERIQKQLKAAEDAREAEIEQLQRQLARDKQLRDLHNTWEANDRQQRYMDRLNDMVQQFMTEEGATSNHLQQLLDMWGGYYDVRTQMMYNFYSNQLRAHLGSHPTGGSSLYELQQQGIIGQAGIVSRMLADAGIGNKSNVSGVSIPTVPVINTHNTNTTERRELTVHVDGVALEPVIQRQLVQSLLEIERNRA